MVFRELVVEVEMPRFSPILFMTICYILGIVLTDFVRFSFWVPVTALSLCLVFLVVGFKPSFLPRSLLPYFSFFLLGFILTSFVICSLQESALLKLARKETYLVASGKVESEPKTSSDQVSFVLKAEEFRVENRLLRVSELTKVVVREGSPKGMKMGDKVEIEGVLSIPRNFGSSDQFDYKNYLYRRRIQTILASTPKGLRVIRNGNYFYRQLHFVRDKVRRNAYRHLGCDKGSLLAAIVIGEKEQVPENVMNDFRDAGLAHVLVVSGLHVGFLAMTLWSLLKWLG